MNNSIEQWKQACELSQRQAEKKRTSLPERRWGETMLSVIGAVSVVILIVSTVLLLK